MAGHNEIKITSLFVYFFNADFGIQSLAGLDGSAGQIWPVGGQLIVTALQYIQESV